MREFFKRLFCLHKDNDVVCWHWTHGVIGYDPLFLEVLLRCKICGKYHFMYIQDPAEYDEFISTYANKEWADTCKSKV